VHTAASQEGRVSIVKAGGSGGVILRRIINAPVK
jgi:hypothetical protein